MSEKVRTKKRKIGHVGQAILLLLAAGISLSASRTVGQQFKIIGELRDEFKKLRRQSLERAIEALYDSKLISEKRDESGTMTLVLSDKGRKKALTYDIRNLRIAQPEDWDKKWRVVMFDIPEGEREARDALREHLLFMGFFEFQRSVLIYPYPCQDELDYLIEFYDIRKYVRTLLATNLDNEAHLLKFFKL